MTNSELKEIRLDIARMSVFVAALAQMVSSEEKPEKEKLDRLLEDTLSFANRMIDKAEA
ncbi:hypothetical protein [Acetobacter sp.]|uniref:hypothetical protein n=1 Tax=Acetobacter sp. TaxID=440 RepID=UPI00258D30FF|nr:hypothetical protein [Acetobacter sp.]MCC6106115.1 hypothetical protein [Acetobacter sp.]